MIYLKHGGGTLLPPPDIHTRRTSTKQAHHHVHAPPSVRNSQLWHFVSAVSHFLNSAEIILALLPSLPSPPSPAGTPQGDSIHHLSAITYHLLTAVSEQGVFNKSHFHFQERDLELYVCALCTHTCMFAQNLGYCASVFIHSLSTYTSTIRLVLVTSLSAVSLLDLHVCLHRLLFASLAWSILSRNGFLH